MSEYALKFHRVVCFAFFRGESWNMLPVEMKLRTWTSARGIFEILLVLQNISEHQTRNIELNKEVQEENVFKHLEGNVFLIS